MDSATQSLIAAWRAAADDLGITIEVPFALQLSSRIIEANLRVRSFGHIHGMLISAGADIFHDFNDEIIAAGYGYSVFGSSCASYDRDLFIDTLSDWSWLGPDGDCPEWCSQ